MSRIAFEGFFDLITAESRCSVFLLCSVVLAEIACAEGLPSRLPLGLPAISIPDSNPLTDEKIALGRQLFFDPRLSSDDQMSCSTCHNPQLGWSNGKVLPVGRNGELLSRSVPTLVNVAYQPYFFWDGRRESLEKAVIDPMTHFNEMNLPVDEAVSKLSKIKGYKKQFLKVFQTGPSERGIAQALAAFLRTLIAGDAPYDRYRAGELAAMSPAAVRGHDIFFFRANCASCHRGPLLTDWSFQNLGIGMDVPEPDLARFLISHDDHDHGRFKTPSLRDVSRTAPYMHDGRFQTLEEVIDLYVDGGIYNSHLSVQLNELPLSAQDKEDLATFLEEGLTSSEYPLVAPPELPR